MGFHAHFDWRKVTFIFLNFLQRLDWWWFVVKPKHVASLSGNKAVIFDGIQYFFDTTQAAHMERHIQVLRSYFLLCGVIW